MLVSIVLYCYNSRESVESALESALRQSLPSSEYEVILIDDASIDETFELIGTYQKLYDNIRYLRFPVNRGHIDAYNYALRSACGKYITRLDADDALHPDMLASCVEPLEQDKTDLAYCDYYEVAYSDNSHSLMQTEPFSPFQMIAGGTLLRTELVKEIGGYHEIFMESCDLYIRYLRLCERSPFHVPQPLYYSCKRNSGPDLDLMKPILGMAPGNIPNR